MSPAAGWAGRGRLDPQRSAARRPGRAGRLSAVVTALVTTAVLAVAAVAAVLWHSTPDVAGAEQLVARALAVQGARDAAGLPAPDRVGSAVIATEDSRFFAHSGIDVVGVLRSSVSALGSPADPGGATLDVQLVKRLYPTSEGGCWARRSRSCWR